MNKSSIAQDEIINTLRRIAEDIERQSGFRDTPAHIRPPIAVAIRKAISLIEAKEKEVKEATADYQQVVAELSSARIAKSAAWEACAHIVETGDFIAPDLPALTKLHISEALRKVVSAIRANIGTGKSWRCFWCDAVFTDYEKAHIHFGAAHSGKPTPECYRLAQREAEDWKLKYEHQAAELREMDEAYNRVSASWDKTKVAYDEMREWRDEAKAEAERLRGELNCAAVYLENLHKNIMENDSDMALDKCESPLVVAENLRSALSGEKA